MPVPCAESKTLQDVSYPWFHMIQWSCEDLESNVVMKWDYSEIRADVGELTSDADTFLVRCPPQEIAGFSIEDGSTYLEWAAALLNRVKTLGPIRYALVPARVNEKDFWERYFASVRTVIIEHVTMCSRESATCVSPAMRAEEAKPEVRPEVARPEIRLEEPRPDVRPEEPVRINDCGDS
eukprot:GHVU01142222.1.p2 GENE.GHVU01142222.1~~GHVU01142222.1.p2  ORF type:complete len:180 (+),score=16.68 GHVU01142222.1:2872-3411(+)